MTAESILSLQDLKVDTDEEMDVVEVTKSFIIMVDSKYDLFNVSEDKEEMLKMTYKLLEPYVKKFAKDGFKRGYKDFKYTQLNHFLFKIIEEVEKLKSLTGEEKKQLVLNIIIILIERELPIPSPAKYLLVQVVTIVIPPLIDAIIELAKKILSSSKFKKFRKKVVKFFTCGN